jgi:hypothetical protein
MLPSLPSTSTSFEGAASANPSQTTPCTADTSGLHSLSEISSSSLVGGSHDEADDGVSQPQPWVHLMACFVADRGMELNLDSAEHHAAVVNESGDGQRSFQRSVEDGVADASDVGFIPERSSGTLADAALNFSGLEQPCGIQSMCMDFYSMSLPPMMFQVWSPREFQSDSADGM